MQDLKNYSLEDLQDLLRKEGYPKFCAGQIFGWVYKKRIEDFSLMTNILKGLRHYLEGNFSFSKIKLLKEVKSSDGTQKFLFKLKDNSVIETVLISENKRNTLCVSTQVGCKFNCTFCESGKGGFKRDLSVCEITNQFLNIFDLISPNKITNIVFMGIGEPLDNFSNTTKAIKMLTFPKGINFTKKKISISTCGLVPEIEKLARLNLGIKLSISLHSADEDIRTKLMPVNKKYPLSELIKAIKQFIKLTKYPVTFEYALINDINIKKEDAKKLAKLANSINAKINLISYNRLDSKFKPISQKIIDVFKEELKKKGAFFTLRKSKGQDIEAACGQLKASFSSITLKR